MDAQHFDALARALGAAGSRRGLLGLLSSFPLLGGLAGLLDPDEVDAKGRRKRRKKRHKHGKGRRRKHHKKPKKCKPKSLAQTCAGKCGSVKNNCKKTVDCGSCDCDPLCETCFTCQGAVGAPGTCVPQNEGTPCGDPATCDSGTVTPQGSCDGSGSCVPGTPVSCAPYTQCDGDACASTCADDDDCVAGSFCNSEGHCVGDEADGTACDHGGQCQSGFCVDGVCCDSACNGNCEACNLSGNVGTCTTEPNGTDCGSGDVCCAGVCQECCTSDECADPEPVCVDGTCEPCSADPDSCPGGTCCNGDSGACVASCPPLQSCGGGGTPNVCGCTPTNPCTAGVCGTVQDNCGNDVNCGGCSNPTPLCVDHVCTACSGGNCPPGQVCCGGSCFAGICCADAECAPSGNDCVSNQCQCGNGNPCSGNTPECCGTPGSCTNTDTDPNNCGSCGGGPCSGATPVCWDGACVCGDVCPSGCQFSSVQAAIDGLTAGSTIRICAGTYGAITINKNLTLIGVGDDSVPASNTILDAAQQGRVVVINPGVTATLQDLRITGGQTAAAAGVDIRTGAALTMTGCTVTQNNANSAGGGGGGIINIGSLTMTDCTVSLNESAASAGGIANFGSLTMTNCSVSGNDAAHTGGGIVNLSGATATLNGCSVTGNTSGFSPAGIRNEGTVNLNAGSTVSGNNPGNCAGTGTFNGTGCA